MMPLHDDPCIWPQAGCTCTPETPAPKKCDYMGCPRCHPWRRPAKPDAECVQDALDKEDDLRDQIANGGC